MSRAFAAVTIASLGAMAVVISGSSMTGSSAEQLRIRSHFDSVLTELRARDVGALSASQRQERASLTGTLRGYRDRGVFPNNYDFPGEAVPYFVDRKTGSLCAVAYLLESTGRRDIVDRVAAMNNNVRVPDLAGDTAFGHWLDAHGVTLAEAARIQVPYMGPMPQQPVQARPVIRKSNVEVTAAVGAASLASFYFSTRGYLRRRQITMMRRDASKLRLTVSPTVSPTDGAGLSFNFKF